MPCEFSRGGTLAARRFVPSRPGARVALDCCMKCSLSVDVEPLEHAPWTGLAQHVRSQPLHRTHSSPFGGGAACFIVFACSLAKVTRALVSSSFLSYSSGLLSSDGKSMTTGSSSGSNTKGDL